MIISICNYSRVRFEFCYSYKNDISFSMHEMTTFGKHWDEKLFHFHNIGIDPILGLEFPPGGCHKNK